MARAATAQVITGLMTAPRFFAHSAEVEHKPSELSAISREHAIERNGGDEGDLHRWHSVPVDSFDIRPAHTRESPGGASSVFVSPRSGAMRPKVRLAPPAVDFRLRHPERLIRAAEKLQAEAERRQALAAEFHARERQKRADSALEAGRVAGVRAAAVDTGESPPAPDRTVAEAAVGKTTSPPLSSFPAVYEAPVMLRSLERAAARERVVRPPGTVTPHYASPSTSVSSPPSIMSL
jgi:hypothetical protein